jgi:hypothetical protein
VAKNPKIRLNIAVPIGIAMEAGGLAAGTVQAAAPPDDVNAPDADA